MSKEETVVTVERLSSEFAHIFQILEEAHDLIWAEDHNAEMFAVIAPLQLILRELSDLSDRIAKDGFAIKEGRVNHKFGGDRASNILSSVRYVISSNLAEYWNTSVARLLDWQCFARVLEIFEEADKRIDLLAHTIQNDFEPQNY